MGHGGRESHRATEAGTRAWELAMRPKPFRLAYPAQRRGWRQLGGGTPTDCPQVRNAIAQPPLGQGGLAQATGQGVRAARGCDTRLAAGRGARNQLLAASAPLLECRDRPQAARPPRLPIRFAAAGRGDSRCSVMMA